MEGNDYFKIIKTHGGFTNGFNQEAQAMKYYFL